MPLLKEDIRTESLIRKNWKFQASKGSNLKAGIFITGSNSFIGCHIVKILQERFDGVIHLLLRATNEKDAVAKMQQAFSQWDLGEFHPERSHIHLGDVSLHMMGLHQKEYNQLKGETGQVIHLAMTPLYHLPYHHFQRVWIPELERMIAFCGDPHSPKALHYASSYNANFFLEEEDFRALNTNAWQSGYAGFKWVSVQAIRNAMQQGLQGCIYDIPLVLGSEKNGICPSHYSIWLILDIFLKTGYFFPFSFRIIPVDTLAEVLVFNVLKKTVEPDVPVIRPMLDEPVTDELFARMAANLLGLHEASLETVRAACMNKLKFNFMIPENFYALMEKVNPLPGILPQGFVGAKLPSTPVVFMSNLNRIMSVKKEMTKV